MNPISFHVKKNPENLLNGVEIWYAFHYLDNGCMFSGEE